MQLLRPRSLKSREFVFVASCVVVRCVFEMGRYFSRFQGRELEDDEVGAPRGSYSRSGQPGVRRQ